MAGGDDAGRGPRREGEPLPTWQPPPPGGQVPPQGTPGHPPTPAAPGGPRPPQSTPGHPPAPAAPGGPRPSLGTPGAAPVPPGAWGPPPAAPTPDPTASQPPPGWWLASDGRWYPPQPGYGYGIDAHATATTPSRDPGAVRALVLGLVGLVFCPIVLSIGAIYEGVQCRRRVAASNGMLTGADLAAAGIVLGAVGLVALPLAIYVVTS